MLRRFEIRSAFRNFRARFYHAAASQAHVLLIMRLLVGNNSKSYLFIANEQISIFSLHFIILQLHFYISISRTDHYFRQENLLH